MNKPIRIRWPEDSPSIAQLHALRAGDFVLFSGVVYAARDEAHKRIVELLRKRRKPPIQLRGKIFYYTGPTPAPRGKIIGSCGPTTSSRMDAFTPLLLQHGLIGMIGKGARSRDVRRAIKKYHAVYFITIGGAGAYLSTKIISAKPVAFRDLGPEAMLEMELRDFPLFVAIDAKGSELTS